MGYIKKKKKRKLGQWQRGVKLSYFMEVSSESPRVPPWDRVGDLPVSCARGVGHLPFIFARG